MSIRRQDGANADLAARRLDDLSAVEKVYVSERPNRHKHLAILYFRDYHDWPYSRIGAALGITKGHACRVHHQMEKRLQEIAKRIFPRVARDPSQDEEN